MNRPSWETFRNIGKAWAKAAPVSRGAAYLKHKAVELTGTPTCRGMARAARRRAEKAAINAELALKNEQLSRNQTDIEVTEQIAKLQQDLRDKQTAFEIETTKRRVDLQVQERKDLQDHDGREGGL